MRGALGGIKLFSDTSMIKTCRTLKNIVRLLVGKEGGRGILLLGSHGVFFSSHRKLDVPGIFYSAEHQTSHGKRLASCYCTCFFTV